MTGELNVKPEGRKPQSFWFAQNTEPPSCSCSKDLNCMKNHTLNVLSDIALMTTGPGRQN